MVLQNQLSGVKFRQKVPFNWEAGQMSITVVKQGNAAEDTELTIRPAEEAGSGKGRCSCKCYCLGPTDVVGSQTDSAQLALQGPD
jgi:hypothetical protein